MPFPYYNRLSADRQRIYRKSDAIDTLGIPPSLELGTEVARIAQALRDDDRGGARRACQALIDALTTGYKVPRVQVRVLAKRPSDDYGELHGLYEPEDEDEGTPMRISVWMRTAQRKQVVAFKTFLRTLIHELCHHLDYELFAMEETFHTEGFYKRESSLVNVLLAQMEDASGPAQTR
jgi:hypothetical protein